jgi:hypothetical protein
MTTIPTTATAVTINNGLSDMQTEMGYVNLADSLDYQSVFQPLAHGDHSKPFLVTAPPGFGVFIRVYNQVTTGALPQLRYPSWYGNLLTYYNAANPAAPRTQTIQLGIPVTVNTTWNITVTMTYSIVGSVLNLEFGAFTPLYFAQIQFTTNPTQLSQRVQVGTYSKPGFNGLTVKYDSGSTKPFDGGGSPFVIPTTYYPIPGSGIGWYIKLFADWQQKYYWIGDLQDFISGGSLVNQATGAIQSFYATMNGGKPEELIINYYITVDRDNTLIIGIAGYQVQGIYTSLGAARRKRRRLTRNQYRSLTRSTSTYTDTSSCCCKY